MRTRDRHTFFVLVGMLALNAFVAAGSAVYLVARERSWRRVVDDLERRVSSAERTCVTASAVAAAVADGYAPHGRDEDPAARPFEPVVVGYGQSRSQSAIWIYRDVRDEWGNVRREYLQRIPLPSRVNEASVAAESIARPHR